MFICTLHYYYFWVLHTDYARDYIARYVIYFVCRKIRGVFTRGVFGG
uniref:Uncharacterized protein n=2 Tax=unclassified Caudoviricetes TaxID=2788787 RepID=A0A8S5UN52_9CAUD|nr:MAG TPA: hypothetical protein [Siphoviridae sp. ctsus30]DAF95842.1 MAG TPA: hypothetical protein [Siphoviridae sp. ctKGQ3]